MSDTTQQVFKLENKLNIETDENYLCFKKYYNCFKTRALMPTNYAFSHSLSCLYPAGKLLTLPSSNKIFKVLQKIAKANYQQMIY